MKRFVEQTAGVGDSWFSLDSESRVNNGLEGSL